MVCFHIVFAYPLSHRDTMNTMNDVRFAKLCRMYNADAIKTYTEKNIQYTHIAVCDMDAVAILRDIPEPMYCVSIKFNKTEIFLYQNPKMFTQRFIPPRQNLFKQVYWTARQLERRIISSRN